MQNQVDLCKDLSSSVSRRKCGSYYLPIILMHKENAQPVPRTSKKRRKRIVRFHIPVPTQIALPKRSANGVGEFMNLDLPAVLTNNSIKISSIKDLPSNGDTKRRLPWVDEAVSHDVEDQSSQRRIIDNQSSLILQD